MPTCAAVGCCVTEKWVSETKISFFRFPKRPERRRIAWVNALKRENWDPTPASRLCSLHFLTGAPSKDPNHPDWIPSVFKHTSKRNNEVQRKAIARYERSLMRKETRLKREGILACPEGAGPLHHEPELVTPSTSPVRTSVYKESLSASPLIARLEKHIRHSKTIARSSTAASWRHYADTTLQLQTLRMDGLTSVKTIMNGDSENVSGVPITLDSSDDAAPEELTDKDELRVIPSPGGPILCRLCAEPCVEECPLYLFQKASDNKETTTEDESSQINDSQNESNADRLSDLMLLIDKTLPIKVSQSDPLPKQVCVKCVDRLRESYSFVLSVVDAEVRLRSMVDGLSFSTSEVPGTAPPKESGCENTPSSGLVRVELPSGPKYCCPLCHGGVVAPSCEGPVPVVKKLVAPEREPTASQSKENTANVAWDGTIIKIEVEEEEEPTAEELERSYRELFDVREDWPVERRTWTRTPQQARRGGPKRARGRPRGRAKMTPRGRRGTKTTRTTVEKILQLGVNDSTNKRDVVRVRSGSDQLHSDALTQCLLCEGWLPGMAACLQHSLAAHTDCGVFLCPRCQQDDFPGDFELIQHFQESHCPDLELCEVSDDESVDPNKNASAVGIAESCDSDIPQTPSMYSEDTDMTRPHSRLSTRTGSLGADNTERTDAEIKQNGDIAGNAEELTLNSLLEDTETQESRDMTVEFAKEDSNMSQENEVVSSVKDDSQITELPEIPVEPEVPFPDEPAVQSESLNDKEELEDDRDDDEQDTKNDTKSSHDRKDPDDHDEMGGDSSGGHSNNITDDAGDSYANGDKASHDTQPESNEDQSNKTPDAGCGNNLYLKRLNFGNVLSESSGNGLITKRSTFRSKAYRLGRKPKRKCLLRWPTVSSSKRRIESHHIPYSIVNIASTPNSIISKSPEETKTNRHIERSKCDNKVTPTICWSAKRRKVA